ncbi:MAG: hypothetical protein R6W90_03060 [Ignavibacteriaceae bacterium]
MKKITGIVVLINLLLFTGCDTVETENSTVSPLSVQKIESIDIDGKQVIATVVYETPTPCWNYHHTEKVKDGNNYIIKAYGKDTDQPCILVLDSVLVEEKINFTTSGNKTLRFWKWNGEFLDTLITIP